MVVVPYKRTTSLRFSAFWSTHKPSPASLFRSAQLLLLLPLPPPENYNFMRTFSLPRGEGRRAGKGGGASETRPTHL